jgi:hypothetical protein
MFRLKFSKVQLDEDDEEEEDEQSSFGQEI